VGELPGVSLYLEAAVGEEQPSYNVGANCSSTARSRSEEDIFSL
jgi:hypothetical protein